MNLKNIFLDFFKAIDLNNISSAINKLLIMSYVADNFLNFYVIWD